MWLWWWVNYQAAHVRHELVCLIHPAGAGRDSARAEHKRFVDLVYGVN